MQQSSIDALHKIEAVRVRLVLGVTPFLVSCLFVVQFHIQRRVFSVEYYMYVGFMLFAFVKFSRSAARKRQTSRLAIDAARHGTHMAPVLEYIYLVERRTSSPYVVSY